MRGQRLTRRRFVARVGRLALAAPLSISLLGSLAGAAYAAPAGQADLPTATPTATSPSAPTATPAAPEATPTAVPTTPEATPTAGATATPSPTAAPALTPTPDAAARPAPPAPSVPGVSRDSVLATLRAGHPRVLLLPEDDARLRRAVATDATARAYRDALVRNGARLLTQPPPERAMIGPRLLAVSRTVLDRVTTLALLYRLDEDPRWAARARTELLAAAAFSDWNPAHFLDVAELCYAFAIGYDWLYDALTPEERAAVRRALVELGLRPAEQAYAARAPWTRASHHWNPVCNGGVAIGALAVGDEEPVLAGSVLAQALESLPRGIAAYAPGGAWIEGPSAWEYATLYLVSVLGALASALGTDFGLSDAPGLNETGRFRLHAAGPTGLLFNFADTRARPSDTASLFWLARRYNDPALAVAAREAANGRAAARDLLWYDASGTTADLAALPLDARYPVAQLAFFRSAWNDADALYVGFKGGDNAAFQAHLDLGTFVLDAHGQRWAIELGPDDPSLPGYLGDERWTFERTRTSGQNTLTLDGANQDPRATAPLVVFQSGADGGLAVADLTAAYAPSGATRVQRGVALRDGRSRVLIQDEVETTAPVEVRWAMHTQAEVDVQGDRAFLSQGGVLLEARLLAPAGATFAVESVTIAPPQQPASDVRRLLVRLPGVTDAQIAVLFTPRRMAIGAARTPTAAAALEPPGLPEIVPLSRWGLASAGSASGSET